jgi:hypothetical protein
MRSHRREQQCLGREVLSTGGSGTWTIKKFTRCCASLDDYSDDLHQATAQPFLHNSLSLPQELERE